MKYVKLGDICSKGVSSLRQKDTLPVGDYPVYGASGICGYLSDYQHNEPYVAVVKDGAGVGRVQLCSGKSSVLGTLQALLPKEEVNCEYLYEVVRSLNLGDGFTGSTIPHIYFKDYKNRTVVIYEKEQQTKITVLFSAVKNLIELHKLAISTYDKLVKSRFVEMFGNSEWPRETIGDIATDIRYGTSRKASESGKYVYLRMNNLTDDGHLDFSDVKAIDLDDDELEKCMVMKGDLLFNRTNSREKVGKTAVFLEDVPMVIAGYIIRVRLSSKMDSEFLVQFMNLPTTKAMLRSMAKGAVHQANINSKELAGIKVPVPPISLQQEFISFVHQVDKLKFDFDFLVSFKIPSICLLCLELDP